ncbi:MAG: LysR family transcriptional regulator [Burkholderiales bacterium]|nr:LysR family transcriptional regulator [Burkholderiales bacterium]
MEISLARTFLEIVTAGSFLRAAGRLHVTQTAVSARVRALEELLGRRLFVRNKSGASLTAAGEQFLRHAQTLVQSWERARQQVAVPAGRRALATVGCELSLWDPLMPDWLMWMRHAAPQLALRAEVGAPGSLLAQIAEGTLDIAVVYAPHERPGLRIELLIEDRLVMVTTSRRDRSPRATDYIFVDWGPEFAAQHQLAFPDLSNAGVFVGLGPLGREYLLAAGGCGYLRLSAVRRHLESGRMRAVEGAPEFLQTAYAVYSAGADANIVTPALVGLRHVAGEVPRSRSRPGARTEGVAASRRTDSARRRARSRARSRERP